MSPLLRICKTHQQKEGSFRREFIFPTKIDCINLQQLDTISSATGKPHPTPRIRYWVPSSSLLACELHARSDHPCALASSFSFPAFASHFSESRKAPRNGFIESGKLKMASQIIASQPSLNLPRATSGLAQIAASSALTAKPSRHSRFKRFQTSPVAKFTR